MMKLELLKQEDVPLMSRKRASLMVEFQGATPSRSQLRKAIAKELKAKEDLTFVRHIYQRFGSNHAKIIVHVYNNEKDAKLIEDNPTIKRHSGDEKKEEVKAQEAEANASE